MGKIALMFRQRHSEVMKKLRENTHGDLLSEKVRAE